MAQGVGIGYGLATGLLESQPGQGRKLKPSGDDDSLNREIQLFRP
jgi:hypothetical protein